MDELKCPICGEPTYLFYGKNPRKDRLCAEHGAMANKGLIEQCPDCKKWHKADENCECKAIKTSSDNQAICPICGKPTTNKEVCNDCYSIIQANMTATNKNESYLSLKDHYYNLKSSIFRIQNKQYVISNLYRLVALAWTMRTIYKNTDLSSRVMDDIKYIVEIKKVSFEKQEENVSTASEIIEDKIQVATSNIAENRAIDGHLCLSAQEVSIDDYLFTHSILHAYNKPVKEIPETERAVVADWFIPIGKKGVYIEYWGIDNKQEYEENKEEKQALYKKYNIPLIEINKNDIKDTQSLETFLYRQLKAHGFEF